MEIPELIEKEKQRQLEGLELIPSENFVSKDVQLALGSIFIKFEEEKSEFDVGLVR